MCSNQHELPFFIKVSIMGKFSSNLNDVISTSEANRVLSQNIFMSDVTNPKSTASRLASVIKLSKLHESMHGKTSEAQALSCL